MALGAFGIASNFAGGMADAIQEGEKIRLQQNADTRAQESHAEEMKKAARETANLEEIRKNFAPGSQYVYTGSNFPDAGRSSYAPDGTAPATTSAPAAPGTVASVRNNNPGAMWPGPVATKFGATTAENLQDGQGNKIATFPDAESGAAAHFALLNQSYAGMPLSTAVRKWSGGNSSDQYTQSVAKATGISPDTVLTPEILSGPQGVTLAKAMARQEAGGEYPLSDDAWQRAQSRAFGKAPPVATGLPGDDGIPKMPDRLAQDSTGDASEVPPVQTAALPTDPIAEASQNAQQKTIGTTIETMGAHAVPGATVVSGLRSEAHNREVGGKPTSWHLSDNARDFTAPPGMTNSQLGDHLQQALGPNFTVIYDQKGHYDHVHVQPTPEYAGQLGISRSDRPGAPSGAMPSGDGGSSSGNVTVYDPQMGTYHDVPRSQVRAKSSMEQAQDLARIMRMQGKGPEAEQMLYHAAQTQLATTKFDQEATQRALQQAAVGGPESFADAANEQLKKVGLHGELVPETIDLGNGKKVTVLKVNQKGTNAPPMYYNRYGQLSATPDTDPSSFTGAVSGISGLFSGDVAANIAQVAKTQTEIEQARINGQRADLERQKAPYEIEEMKGKPALQQAQTANLNAEAEYRKNQMQHDQVQLQAQAHLKAAEDINKMKINGVLDSDPLKAAKQKADIYAEYGIGAQGHISSDGKISAAPGLAPAASTALPGKTTTTGPNPYGAGSPSPAGPTIAAANAAKAALPTPGAAAAPSGPPAPVDDSPLGAIGRGVHSIIQSQKQSYQQTARDHADAAWNGEAGQSYAKVNYSYYKNQAPNASDVNALARSLKSWPWLADKMDPNVVKYVKEHTK